MIEETYFEIKCDFCDEFVENKYGGVVNNITRCLACKKDFCCAHGKYYYDGPNDGYPDFVACQDCVPRIDVLWAEGIEYLQRHESLHEYIINQIKSDEEENSVE